MRSMHSILWILRILRIKPHPCLQTCLALDRRQAQPLPDPAKQKRGTAKNAGEGNHIRNIDIIRNLI